LAAFGFLEELLPFTDFVPTATIAWCAYRYGFIGPNRRQNPPPRSQTRRTSKPGRGPVVEEVDNDFKKEGHRAWDRDPNPDGTYD